MIIQMRRRLKSMPWLWIAVAVSMAWAPGILLFFRGDSANVRSIGRVNGLPITAEKFYQVKAQEQLYRSRLASFGFEQFAGPVELSHLLTICARDLLLDSVAKLLNLEVDPAFLRKSIVESFGKELVKADGTVNIEAYKEAVRSIFSTGIEEYENEQRQHVKRQAVQELIKQAAYEPEYVRLFDAKQSGAKKSFEILTVPFNHFEKEASKGDLSNEILEKFFEAHRKEYMTEEKRSARFAELVAKDDTVEVSDFEISEHYERYCSTKYMAPAQFQVRYAVFPAGTEDAGKRMARAVATKTRDRIVESGGENDLTVVARYEGKEAGMTVTAKLTPLFSLGDKLVPPTVERAVSSLQKTGEISELLESTEGIYLVQLFKHLSPAPLPIDSVKGEIKQLIRKRKAAHAVRIELEQFVRALHDDPEDFDAFVKDRGLKLKSAEYSEHDLKMVGSQKNSLVKHLFDWKRELPYLGYLPTDDGYLLFSLDKVEKPTQRAFEQVKEEVKRAYILQEAMVKMVQFVKDVHENLLRGKTTFAELASKQNFELEKTRLLAREEQLAKPKVDGLLAQAFDLTGQNQVLLFRQGDNFYLCRLLELERNEQDLKSSKWRDERLEFEYVEGYIASVLRDAKIEFSSDLVEIPAGE